MDFIYVAVFSELQTCLQDQNQVKSVTDLESCWVNLLTFFFSKKIRHFMSRTSFLALTKKIWKRCIQTDLSLVSCLEQLSGKISLGWKNLVGFKMWLQCSRGTLCDMVAGVALQGTSGVIWFCFKFAGIWGGKRRSEKQAVACWRPRQETTDAVIQCRKRWSPYIEGARVVTVDGQLTVPPPWRWLRRWKVWLGGDAWKPGACRRQYATVCGLFSSWHLDIWKRS